MNRALSFYETILDIEMESMTFQNGIKMALFPVELGEVGGALCRHKEFYNPGHEGALVYLSASLELQQALNRVDENGGKFVVPKSQISEEHGFMAVFEDCEGTPIALHSPIQATLRS